MARTVRALIPNQNIDLGCHREHTCPKSLSSLAFNPALVKRGEGAIVRVKQGVECCNRTFGIRRKTDLTNKMFAKNLGSHWFWPGAGVERKRTAPLRRSKALSWEPRFKTCADLFRRIVQTLLVTFTISNPHAHAATIARIDIDRLVNQAELIFQGEVTNVEARQDERGYIYTYIDFRIEDIVAGDSEIGTTLQLRFSGGAVGDRRLDLGIQFPRLNERGLYFVEGINTRLVNPLLGWQQGHFTITDDGTVVAGNGEPVKSVEPQISPVKPDISSGVAAGIETIQPTLPRRPSSHRETVSGPMLLEDFKTKIRSLRR